VTILEVARTLQKLIREGKLARPARTIRFIWPPEIEGTMAFLNGSGVLKEQTAPENGKPDQPNPERPIAVYLTSHIAKRIKAVVHMDMVGGGPETKAVFHVTRGPMSLPSFVHDVAWAFAEFVNEESYKFAASGKADYPFVAPEGSKEPLRAEYSAYTMGSDHDVYQDSSFGIPAIYLNDWPDRYIHTNFDTAANIDPTKLKRAAFIGAASGYFLAGNLSEHAADISRAVKNGELLRHVQKLTRDGSLSKPKQEDSEAGYCYYERKIDAQLDDLKKNKKRDEPNKEERPCLTDHPHFDAPDEETNENLVSYKRKTETRGPLAVFGYDYFNAEWLKRGGAKRPRLLEYEGLWGTGEEYAYEVLNLAGTVHTHVRIWEEVSAEYGPVPYELVVEYLKALEKIGVVAAVK
jgi:hypothetical protein